MDKLKFTPYAWSKLLYLRDKGSTEVSFFGVSRKGSLDLVEDLFMPFQHGAWATTEFIDDKLPKFFDDMVDLGYHPEEFGRIWCHTHPGDSATPSSKDEATFSQEFVGPNWAIMFIVGKKGATTCRLRYKCHPDLAHILPEGATRELPVEIAWGANSKPVTDEVRAAWNAEYDERLVPKSYTNGRSWKDEPYSKYINNFSNLSKKDDDEYVGSWRPGPGWRRSVSGSWIHNIEWANEDYSRGIVTPDDYARIYGKGGAAAPDNKLDNRKLTRKERKYMRKHGTLLGFNSAPQLLVPIEKLEKSEEAWIDEVAAEWEANQRILDEESAEAKYWTVILDNGERRYNVKATAPSKAMDFVDEDIFDFSITSVPYACAVKAFIQEGKMEEQNWTVTLEDGTKINNVPGFDGTDAVNRCCLKMKQEPCTTGDDKREKETEAFLASAPSVSTMEPATDPMIGWDPSCSDIC